MEDNCLVATRIATHPALAAAEIERRREAVAKADAIVAFAGGSGSPMMRALLSRFSDGELTMDEVRAEYLRRLRGER
jgi:hypothetical protein